MGDYPNHVCKTCENDNNMRMPDIIVRVSMCVGVFVMSHTLLCSAFVMESMAPLIRIRPKIHSMQIEGDFASSLSC